jgi:hypothetical protein
MCSRLNYSKLAFSVSKGSNHISRKTYMNCLPSLEQFPCSIRRHPLFERLRLICEGLSDCPSSRCLKGSCSETQKSHQQYVIGAKSYWSEQAYQCPLIRCFLCFFSLAFHVSCTLLNYVDTFIITAITTI